MAKVCEVSCYSDDYNTVKDIAVVHGATLWMDTTDNQEDILIFKKALWMGHSITNSMDTHECSMCWPSVLEVNPVLLFLSFASLISFTFGTSLHSFIEQL